MTAPKKKSPAKPKTAAKAAPKKKLPSDITGGENVVKSPSNEAVADKEVKAKKAPAFLKKKASEFTVGTEQYGKVVAEFNKLFKRQYNTHRVPPYIFKTMLDRLRKYYNVNE